MNRKCSIAIEHSTVVVLPSVGIRRHRLFLTSRPNCRVIARRPPPILIGPPVYDTRCDDEPNLIPTVLSVLVMLILCMTVLRAL